MRTRSIISVLLLSAPVCGRAQTVTGAIRGVIEDPASADLEALPLPARNFVLSEVVFQSDNRV